MPDPETTTQPPPVSGHLLAVTYPHEPTTVTIEPTDADVPPEVEVSGGRYEAIRRGGGRLPTLVPSDPTPYNNRVPVPYEPQGYIHIFPRATESTKLGIAGVALDEAGEILLTHESEAPAPVGDYMTDQAFESLAEEFKGTDGKFLAMTAYGAVPLPDQMLRSIPEKLVWKPVIQEREIFVIKQEEQTRTYERDYTQFEHVFVDIPQSLVVNKLELKQRTKSIQVPHFNYKPLVEDKVVEIPLGIKYVEIPIEVECRMPPKIIPVPRPHIVERLIETTKPVVQEKIVEVPEIVIKKVPRIVIKEIPYVVPKYVEKIIEVPYQPGQSLPPPKGAPMTVLPLPPPLPGTPGAVDIEHRGMHAAPEVPGGDSGLAPTPRMSFATAPQFGEVPGFPSEKEYEQYGKAPQQPSDRYPNAPSPDEIAPRAYVEEETLVVEEGPLSGEPQTFYLAQGIRNVKLPYEAKIEVSIVEQEEVPEGVPIAQPHVRYMAPAEKAVAYNEPSPRPSPRPQQQAALRPPQQAAVRPQQQQQTRQSRRRPLDPIYAGPMEPIVAHAPPGMRAIEFKTKTNEPEILTQQGVMKYSKFESCLKRDVSNVLPDLPDHRLVPMDPPGTPSLQKMAKIHLLHAERTTGALKHALKKQERRNS